MYVSMFGLLGYRGERQLFTAQLQIGGVLFAIRLRLPRKIQLSSRSANDRSSLFCTSA